jgi:CheY-like chemotaxis protein
MSAFRAENKRANLRSRDGVQVFADTGLGSDRNRHLPETHRSPAHTQKVFLANDLALLKHNLKRIRNVKKEFSRQILFVDDDEKMLNAYGRMLRKSPWKIFKATSGAKALEVIENNRIDLIVTDIKMPEMHGMELISKIRGKNRDTPIVVSSGYPGMKEDVDLKYHGIEAFISKPIDDSKLYSELARILES